MSKKDAYFQCRAKKLAKNKKAWPHKDAKKQGTCRVKFLAWQKSSPKAANAWKAGLDAVVYAGDAKKANTHKEAYDKCRRRRKAAKKDYYPQKVKGWFRLGKKSNFCKSQYVAWKKYQPTGTTTSTSSGTVGAARSAPSSTWTSSYTAEPYEALHDSPSYTAEAYEVIEAIPTDPFSGETAITSYEFSPSGEEDALAVYADDIDLGLDEDEGMMAKLTANPLLTVAGVAIIGGVLYVAYQRMA